MIIGLAPGSSLTTDPPESTALVNRTDENDSDEILTQAGEYCFNGRELFDHEENHGELGLAAPSLFPASGSGQILDMSQVTSKPITHPSMTSPTLLRPISTPLNFE
jgi:hypothetical protein